MAEFLVENIEKGQRDSNRSLIDTVYARVTGKYAVYRAEDQVMIQWADSTTQSDDPAKPLGMAQREALGPLTPLRGDITGLIDGWRSDSQWWWSRDRNQGRARRYDRAVAQALVVALSGDVPRAAERLTRVREDIRDERIALGRVQFALWAVSVALAVALVSFLVGAHYADLDWGRDVPQRWAAAGFGAFGAFLSLAIGIRSREVELDLRRSDNAVNASLRIAVGAMSAVTLVALLQSGILEVRLLNASLGRSLSFAGLIAASIAAGFTERLVADVLKNSTVGATARPGPTPTPAAQRGGEGNPRPANPASAGGAAGAGAPGNPGGAPAQAVRTDPPPDDDIDGCLHDRDAEPEALTDDVELPAARGGVEGED